MATYLFLNFIFTAFLTIVWNSENFVNVIVKLMLFSTSLFSLIYFLIQTGVLNEFASK